MCLIMWHTNIFAKATAVSRLNWNGGAINGAIKKKGRVVFPFQFQGVMSLFPCLAV